MLLNFIDIFDNYFPGDVGQGKSSKKNPRNVLQVNADDTSDFKINLCETKAELVRPIFGIMYGTSSKCLKFILLVILETRY